MDESPIPTLPSPDASYSEFTAALPDFIPALDEGFQCIENLASEVSTSGISTESVIALLTGSLAEDLQDILVLCSTERRNGALRLLRTPFEKFLYAHHIVNNPEAAEAFVMFDALQTNALMKGIEEQYGPQLSTEGRFMLGEMFKAAQQRFKRIKCEKCGGSEPRMWTKVLPEQMAKQAGIEDLHVLAYRYATLMLHPSFRGITNQMNYTFKMPAILVIVHRLTVETLQLQWKQFKKSGTVQGPTAHALQRLYQFLQLVMDARKG